MISYAPLWKTMAEKKISKYMLIRNGIAQSTISRMVKNKPTSSETINALCRILDCKVGDIMEYTNDDDVES